MPDPHAWQNLANGHLYVSNIEAALAEADPGNAAAYEAAGAISPRSTPWTPGAQIAEVPPERRKVVTSHDAFGYFGAAYGVVFVAPEGIARMPSPRPPTWSG